MSYVNYRLHLYIVSELIHNEYYKDIVLRIGELLIYLDIFNVMKYNLTINELFVKKSVEEELSMCIKKLTPITTDVECIYQLARELL